MLREVKSLEKGLIEAFARVESNAVTKGGKHVAVTAHGSGVYTLTLSNVVAQRLVHADVTPIGAGRMVNFDLAGSSASTFKFTLTSHDNTAVDTDFNARIVFSSSPLDYTDV